MTSRLLKRLISGALALSLVFSINGFAAVVTDNDGSAFITKAEFDSLKNSFQAQIDSYNQAIDSKIDGAIAAYLAGIQLRTRKVKEPLYNSYNISTNTESRLYWSNRTDYSYCNKATQKSSNKGVIHSVGYYANGSGATTRLGIKTIGAADISTDEVKEDRCRFNNDANGFINTLNKCSYDGTWVSCNGLWLDSTYQGYLHAEFKNMMKNTTYGVGATFGNDRSKKAWSFAYYQQRLVDNYGAQKFANLVYSWNYSAADTNYVICPLSDQYDYGDTIDKTIYTEDIISDIFETTTVGPIKNWANQSNIGTGMLDIPLATATRFLNFSWPVFRFFDAKKSNEEMFASFNSLNENNREFKNGLVFEKCDAKGTLSISVTPSTDGKIVFYKSNIPDNDWAGTKSIYNTQDIYNCSANTLYRTDFDVDVSDLIWVVYLPNGNGFLSDCLVTYILEN